MSCMHMLCRFDEDFLFVVHDVSCQQLSLSVFEYDMFAGPGGEVRFFLHLNYLFLLF